MAQAIIGGKLVTTEVVYLGNLFNIWRVHEEEVNYTFLLNQEGARSIAATGEDYEEVDLDLTKLNCEEITEKEFEAKWYTVIQTALNSLL